MPEAPAFPPAPDQVKPVRALISLSDKTGLVEAAQTLSALGVELISTGGTRAAIAAAGLPVKDVSDLTGFPEMMDGRVKTLHPKVHGGLLAYRDAPEHAQALSEHDIAPIDIVWIDLYPFEKTVEGELMDPTFVFGYPAEVSPLSRANDADPFLTDRFEFFLAGRELANGFSELNDPEDQAERFRAQVQRKSAGDDEAMAYDADYIRALEYGMPPTAGLGIGVDRLVMFLTDQAAIRDVLLFPHVRPES